MGYPGLQRTLGGPGWWSGSCLGWVSDSARSADDQWVRKPSHKETIHMFSTSRIKTRTGIVAAGLAAIALAAVAPAAEGAITSAPAISPEVTLAPTVVEPAPEAAIAEPVAPVTPVAPVAPIAPVERGVGPGGHTPPPKVVTETSVALEVDGVPGGYSRQKCERLAGQW